MNMRLTTSQVQKQILTPLMQQSIGVLLLPLLELNARIEEELQNNPLLEIDEEKLAQQEEEPDIDELRRRLDDIRASSVSPSANEPDEDMAEQRPLKFLPTLEDDLLRQLRLEIKDELDLRIGELIIGNIDEDGYLAASVEEIAKALDIQDLARVEQALLKVQHFEPWGIAARNLRECLLPQAEERVTVHRETVIRIIQNYLKELAQKKFEEIGRRLRVPPEEVKAAARIITTLDPKPGRNYRPLDPRHYIRPDVVIQRDAGDQIMVHINQEGVPPLHINQTYHQMLKHNNLTGEEKAFLRERLKNAVSFIKSIEQRGETIRGITDYILKRQKEFFEEGMMVIAPMTLKNVAQALNRNESTISRAISNKYIATPDGVFPMKFFFSQAVGRQGQDNGPESRDGTISNRTIKEEIIQLIKDEDKSKPLADQEIQEYFKAKGIPIARRTVSKYRQAARILPSHLRRQ